jgi:magnesium-transporting ATPase (P-type)
MLGLVGLVDPPRPEAVAAVAECQRAGIRVKMITGDHAGTAAAIGAQVGLSHPSPVLTGKDIDAMSDAALGAAVMETDVYARTSPEHKLRLVKALQAHGLTVAMTGDGVNDAPALKRADAGIAMGRKGSEAAKEAADLVLADDNFASIAAAVREGRTVHDNIRKVLTWTLPTNGGEALVIILALLAGMSLPITPVQILWVNLITTATLGMALAFEPTEARTMVRPPRHGGESLITGQIIWQVVLVSILMMVGVFAVRSWALDRGYAIELTRTLVTNVLVAMEVAYLFFVRNRHSSSLTWQALRATRVVWTTVLIVALGQLAFTAFAPMQAVFGTRAMGLVDTAVLLVVAAALFALLEAEKQIRLSLRQP